MNKSLIWPSGRCVIFNVVTWIGWNGNAKIKNRPFAEHAWQSERGKRAPSWETLYDQIAFWMWKVKCHAKAKSGSILQFASSALAVLSSLWCVELGWKWFIHPIIAASLSQGMAFSGLTARLQSGSVCGGTASCSLSALAKIWTCAKKKKKFPQHQNKIINLAAALAAGTKSGRRDLIFIFYDTLFRHHHPSSISAGVLVNRREWMTIGAFRCNSLLSPEPKDRALSTCFCP